MMGWLKNWQYRLSIDITIVLIYRVQSQFHFWFFKNLKNVQSSTAVLLDNSTGLLTRLVSPLGIVVRERFLICVPQLGLLCIFGVNSKYIYLSPSEMTAWTGSQTWSLLCPAETSAPCTKLSEKTEASPTTSAWEIKLILIVLLSLWFIVDFSCQVTHCENK